METLTKNSIISKDTLTFKYHNYYCGSVKLTTKKAIKEALSLGLEVKKVLNKKGKDLE
jgi:hypothetical protein